MRGDAVKSIRVGVVSILAAIVSLSAPNPPASYAIDPPVSTFGVTVAGSGWELGLSLRDTGHGIAVDGSGNVYVPDMGHSFDTPGWTRGVNRWTPGQTAGIAVAGTRGAAGYGSGLGQFLVPGGVAIDAFGNVFVSDISNHRVMRWAPGATSGVVVAGGSGPGPGANQLYYPEDVTVDSSGNLYVVDRGNDRIVRWSPGATSGVTVAGANGHGSRLDQLALDGAFNGIALDDAGSLYVADSGNNRVVRWTQGAAAGTLVAGGGPWGSGPKQFMEPTDVAVDAPGNVFVVDHYNYRVQRWSRGAAEGVTVAGGTGQGLLPDQLYNPIALALGNDGTIYILNYGCCLERDSVVRWTPGSPSGEIVAPGFMTPAGLQSPTSLDIDASGTMYVCDARKKRVVKIPPGSLRGETVATGPCVDIAVDSVGSVFVSSGESQPILQWNPGSKSGVVVGGSTWPLRGARVEVDGSGNLFVPVVEPDGPRVVRRTPSGETSVVMFGAPSDLALDAAGSLFALFPGPPGSIRRWDPTTGQVSVVVEAIAPSRTNPLYEDLWPLTRFAVHLDDFYVITGPDRVLRFRSGSTTGELVAGGNEIGFGADQLYYASGLVVDTAGDIFIADSGNNRIQLWGPTAIATGLDVPAAPAVYVASSGGIAQVTLADTTNKLLRSDLSASTAVTGTALHGASCASTNGGRFVGVTGTTKDLALGGLTVGKTYRCFGLRRNFAGTGSVGSSASFMAAPGVPGAPSSVVAVSEEATSASGSLRIAFRPPSRNGGRVVAGYSAQCSRVSSATWSQVVSAPASPVLIEGLMTGVAYICRVRARNLIGWGPWTASLPVRVGAPKAPANVTVSPEQISGFSARLRVSYSAAAANGSSLSGYGLRCTQTDSTASVTAIAAPNVTSVLMPPVSIVRTPMTLPLTGTAYNCSVWGVNARGSGSLGRSVVSPAATAPATDGRIVVGAPRSPTGVSAKGAGRAKVDVVFQSPASNGGSPITGYTARCVSTNGGTSWQLSGVSVTSAYRVAGLTPGKAYRCFVAARNAFGLGVWSNPSPVVVVE